MEWISKSNQEGKNKRVNSFRSTESTKETYYVCMWLCFTYFNQFFFKWKSIQKAKRQKEKEKKNVFLSHQQRQYRCWVNSYTNLTIHKLIQYTLILTFSLQMKERCRLVCVCVCIACQTHALWFTLSEFSLRQEVSERERRTKVNRVREGERK